MFNIFKRKRQIDSSIFDLVLKLEHQQKQMDELRAMILELSKQVNTLQIEIDYLSQSKYGKSL
jgi:polyhydroxyalkanoate synthesis regulator phasin